MTDTETLIRERDDAVRDLNMTKDAYRALIRRNDQLCRDLMRLRNSGPEPREVKTLERLNRWSWICMMAGLAAYWIINLIFLLTGKIVINIK